MPYLCLRQYSPESPSHKILQRRYRFGSAEHALGSEDDQRFSRRLQCLAPQEMKSLNCCGGLTYLNIVVHCQLQVTVHSGA